MNILTLLPGRIYRSNINLQKLSALMVIVKAPTAANKTTPAAFKKICTKHKKVTN